MTVAVHPALVDVAFVGSASAGPISVPGLKVGDKLIWLKTNTAVYVSTEQQLNGFAWMELVVTVDDEIQQIDNRDHSSETFTAVLLRG